MGEEMIFAGTIIVAVGIAILVVADLTLYYLSTRVFYKVMAKVAADRAAVERSIAELCEQPNALLEPSSRLLEEIKGMHEDFNARLKDMRALTDRLREAVDR